MAHPTRQDIKQLEPSFTREFNQYVPFEVELTLTVLYLFHVLFIISIWRTAFHKDPLSKRQSVIQPFFYLRAEQTKNLTAIFETFSSPTGSSTVFTRLCFECHTTFRGFVCKAK